MICRGLVLSFALIFSWLCGGSSDLKSQEKQMEELKNAVEPPPPAFAGEEVAAAAGGGSSEEPVQGRSTHFSEQSGSKKGY